MSEAARWSYRTGTWFAVFGSQTTLLLPADQKDRVVALWSGIDDGADFSAVLDGLLASGLSGIRAFALVSGDAAATRVLVRGDGVRAVLTTADGEVEVDGSGASTWSEQTVADVTACRVDLPSEEAEAGDATDDDEEAVDHTVVTGLVRVGRIDRPPFVVPVASAPEPEPILKADPVLEPGHEVAALPPEAAEEDRDEADHQPLPEPEAEAIAPGVVDEPGPDPVVETEPDLGPPTEHLSLTDLPEVGDLGAEPTSDDVAPAPVTDAEPDPASEPDPVEPMADLTADLMADPLSDPLSDPLTDSQEAEVHDAPTPSEPGAPASAASVVDDDEGWLSPPSGPPAPYAPPVEPSDAPPFSPPPLPVGSWSTPDSPPTPDEAAGTDHDGLTRTGTVDESEFARQQPGIPGQPPAPAITRAVARLLISDGETVEVDRVVLIGRAPEARRFTSTEQPVLVTVPSPLHEISSTHIEVRPGTGADHGSAVVTDMGSTNGTVLAQPGLPPEDLKPGIAVQLNPGAIINLGDGVTIQVTRP